MDLQINDELKNWDKYIEHYSKSDGVYMPEEHCWQCERTLPRLAWAVSVIVKKGYKSVIDFGSKDGYLPLTLSRIGVEAKGVDLAKDAIEMARERNTKFGTQAQFQVVAIEDYLPEKKYDCAVLFEVIDRVISPKKVLDKCKESADSLLLSTPDYYGRFGWDDRIRNLERLRIYKEPELIKLLEKYGKIEEFTIADGAMFVHVNFLNNKNGKKKD